MSLPKDLRSRLATLLVLLLGAVALYAWAVREDLLSRPRPTSGLLYPGLDVASIDWLHLGLRAGQDLELSRELPGAWWITSPTREYARQERIEAILDNVARAQVQPVEELQGPIASRDVGLDPPRHVIAFRAGGRTETLALGEVEPLGRDVYARRSGGEDRIVLATRNLVTLLQDNATEFVDPALLRGLQGPVERILVEGGGQRLLAERAGTEWTLLAPEAVLADGDRLDQLVRTLQFVQSERVVLAAPADSTLHELGLPSAAEAASGEGHGATHVEISARGERPVGAWLAAGWQGEAGDVLAVRDDFGKVITVPHGSLAVLSNPPDWFREHHLLPPVRERAASLRLERGGEARLDIRQDADKRWNFAAPERLAGSPVESERVEAHSLLGDFLGRIDELQVRAFLPVPGGEPEARMVVGWIQAGKLRQDRVDLFFVEGRVVAVTTERPAEGLELPPDVLELFEPGTADLLRPLRPLALDLSRWAGLSIELPGGGAPLEIRRELPDGPWTGDDEWTRRVSVGHDLARGLRGLRWVPARPGATYGWRMRFLDAAGDALADLRLRMPEADEPPEVLGQPAAFVALAGREGVELVVHRNWIERLDELAAPLVRKPLQKP